ncbi:hypothetical protein [Paraburkholderia sediminicola]|uniref:hypothetical protein n=1 Tax=Paraburkholderia sediminicola TaxID=458836 RepID=UPI0038BAE97F
MNRTEQTGADELTHVPQRIRSSRRRLVSHRPIDVGNEYRVRRVRDKRLQPLFARAQRVLGRRVRVLANPPQHLQKQQRQPHPDRQNHRRRYQDDPLHGNEPVELRRRIVAMLCRCCEDLVLDIVEERIGRILVDLIGFRDVVIVDGLEHRLGERSILRVLFQQAEQHRAAAGFKRHRLLQRSIQCRARFAVLAQNFRTGVEEVFAFGRFLPCDAIAGFLESVIRLVGSLRGEAGAQAFIGSPEDQKRHAQQDEDESKYCSAPRRWHIRRRLLDWVCP